MKYVFNIRALIYISCSGGLGGIIYSIRGFYQNLVDDKYNFNWVWWFILRPIIMVIGIFLYFLIVGGLMSLGAIQDVDFLRSIIFYWGGCLSGWIFIYSICNLT